MNTQYCKVGKTSPSGYLSFNLSKLQNEYNTFIEEAYSLMHIDQSLSDFMFHEASQLKRKILTLRKFI